MKFVKDDGRVWYKQIVSGIFMTFNILLNLTLITIVTLALSAIITLLDLTVIITILVVPIVFVFITAILLSIYYWSIDDEEFKQLLRELGDN